MRPRGDKKCGHHEVIVLRSVPLHRQRRCYHLAFHTVDELPERKLIGMIEKLAASIERHVGRVLGPAVSPVLHGRRARTLRHASIDPAAERRARDSWWGDDPRWFPGGTPPRQLNRITPLIDGDAFFDRLYTELKAAEHYVYVTGWCLTPYVPLIRGTVEDQLHSRLLVVLSEAAKRVPVRILLWSGAPFIIQPTRSVVKETQRLFRERASGDLVCALDNTAHLSHCHHQKAIVIDGQRAFVGGMDLTTFAGDRWDEHSHGLRAGTNWHDVEALIEGEAVGDVEENFRQRWTAVTGDTRLPHRPPAADPAWATPAQIVRTIPRKTYDFAPDGEFGIHHVYTEAIRRARRLIYLETQYLWSPEIMEALISAMNTNHEEPFRIVVVLPARATSGKWDNDRHVAKLREADGGRGIAEVYSLYASGPNSGVVPFQYRPTYVHAKVGIMDDEWLTIGSANLNTRGLVTDSELNVVACDAGLAKALRTDLWAEHLRLQREAIAEEDPIKLIDTVWRQSAADNAAVIREAQAPLLSQVHRYEVGRAPGASLLEESEALTFEH